MFLSAVRARAEAQELIALRASLNLPQPRPASETAAPSPASETAAPSDETGNDDRATPHLTLRGKLEGTEVGSTLRKRGRKPLPRSVPTTSETRLLALLDRPRRGRELAPLLGVTNERVRQMIAALLQRDFIRTADPDHPTSIIARKNDTSLLLRQRRSVC